MVRERTGRGGGECAGHSRQVQCIRRARSLLCRPRPCQKVAVSVSVGTEGAKGGFSVRPSFFPEENHAATVAYVAGGRQRIIGGTGTCC